MAHQSAQYHRHAVVFVTLVSLICSTLVKSSDVDEKTGLEIHNTFKPEICDRKVKHHDVLTLHYKGYLPDGKVFDSSYDRNQPFTFQISIGQVIRGWELGLLHACVGEKRRLVIPPNLAYGDAKHDQIPAGSTLIFEIEILKIADGPKPINVFKEIDTDGDGRIGRKEMGEFLKKQLNQGGQHGDMGLADDPEQLEMVDEIFMTEDKDKDDYITHDEFSGPKDDHDEL